MDINIQQIRKNPNLLETLRKGAFHTVVYRKQVALAKKYQGYTLETESVIQGRFGVDYDNLKAVIEARANGAPKGELKGYDTLVEDLLYKSQKTGEIYVRFTPFNGSRHSKRYFLNGVETPLSKLETIFPPSVLGTNGNGNPPLVLSLRLNAIADIR